MLRFHALAIAAIVLLIAPSAHAQQSSVARLSMLGRYAGLSSVCEDLGFKVREEKGPYIQLVLAEAAKAGFSEEEAYAYMTPSLKEAGAETSASWARLSGSVANGPGFVAAVTGQVREWVNSCREIASDPIGRLIVEGPATSDDVLIRESADEILTPAGWASWQTPYTRQGGVLAYSVGKCSAHLTRAQIDAYTAQLNTPGRFPAEVASKARDYFAYRIRIGKENVRRDTTAKQCAEILKRDAQALNANR
jgi:hypothetical protein